MKTQTALLSVQISILALACSAPATPPAPAGPSHPTTLDGTIWSVVSVAGRAPIINSRPSVTFTATEIKGSTGCYGFGGGYRYDGTTGAIAIGKNLFMTEMACPGGRDEFETAFIHALAQSTTTSRDADGRLILSGAGGQMILVTGQ
jgi:heat shock protein HslJ